tara:strand:+ start:2819 stop:3376 length:558 start_codon:yes stop_codon:yes gene_type:complete
MKISKFYEDNNLMIRAAKVARMSWDSEHKSDSTPEGLGEADLKLAVKLMKAGSDHSAAFRQVVVWFEMSASRGFYQHFAKYRHGVEMYSTSLMHTGTRQEYTQEMFRHEIPPLLLNELNLRAEAKDLEGLTNIMPEGYLQRRAIMLSYPAMRSIYASRSKHRKPEWREFLEQLLELMDYPELITT